jgi:aldehyde:ferredoxin oxidoreductase
MPDITRMGYAGKILRVDLSDQKIGLDELDQKTVGETEKLLKEELGVNKYGASVFGIGPAGENLVRHAGITGDGGHSASHNGLGAVMGSKNLKAVVAFKSKGSFGVWDPDLLKTKAGEMVAHAVSLPRTKWGTGGGFSTQHEKGSLPIKNYTTNIFPEHEKMNGQYMRTHFKVRARPCYKCAVAHVKEVTVTEGPYTGFVGEEPEYELLAAFGPQIGNTDLGAVVMLSNEVDTLGMDIKDERPSARYGSIPVDGPNKGVDIMEKWDEMVTNYYTRMGWDPVTGAPLAETLNALDLSDTIQS